jgi:hypothetical protein
MSLRANDLPAGSQLETIQHTLCCKGTMDIRNPLREIVLELVNRWRGCRPRDEMNRLPFLHWLQYTANQPIDPLKGTSTDRLTWFPQFWEPEKLTREVFNNLSETNTSALFRASNPFYKQGYVPRALTTALLNVGIHKHHVKKAVDQIQTAIVWTYSRCWAKRCKTYWTERRKLEKERQKALHDQLKIEYLEKLRIDEEAAEAVRNEQRKREARALRLARFDSPLQRAHDTEIPDRFNQL